MATVSALALESAHIEAAALVCILGVLAAGSRRLWPIAAPLGVAALVDPTILPWTVAAAALSWGPRPEFLPPRLDSEPQRELMRLRRLNHTASVVVLQAPKTKPAQVWPLLRATDGFDMVTGHDGVELRAVLEDEGLDRRAFAERIHRVLSPSDVRVGWASFPADGATLEVLVDAARAQIVPADVAAVRPVTEPAAIPPARPTRAPAIAGGS